jgi:signal peptidase I
MGVCKMQTAIIISTSLLVGFVMRDLLRIDKISYSSGKIKIRVKKEK